MMCGQLTAAEKTIMQVKQLNGKHSLSLRFQRRRLRHEESVVKDAENVEEDSQC
jgi:hypothetical protein